MRNRDRPHPPRPNELVDDPYSWLNFSLPSHPTSFTPRSATTKQKRSGRRTKAISDRARFVNTSFKFILKPTETLSFNVHLVDPDRSLHWPNVLQIIVPTFSALSVAQGFVSSLRFSGFSNIYDDSNDSEWRWKEAQSHESRRRLEEEKQGRKCPICLDKPLAGRMSECGHIFCFPCILHYIQLSDIPHVTACPICGGLIQIDSLKSVKYLGAEAMLKASDGETERLNLVEPSLSGRVLGEGSFDHQLQGTTSLAGHPQESVNSRQSSPIERLIKKPTIHMRLVQRSSKSTLALPSSSTYPSVAFSMQSVPWHFLPDVLTYSRYMLATPEYMTKELKREIKDLEVEQRSTYNDDLSVVFIEDAIKRIQQQINRVQMELDTSHIRKLEKEGIEAWKTALASNKSSISNSKDDQHTSEALSKQDVDSQRNVTSHSSSHTVSAPSQEHTNIIVDKCVPPSMTFSSHEKSKTAALNHTKVTPASHYYFYQSALGTNVFLHPLDNRILLAHFKDYKYFSPEMTFSVLNYSYQTVSDDLRKRCKYLNHLPIGVEIIFIETDSYLLLTPEVFQNLEQSVKNRIKQRKNKLEIEEKKIAQEQLAERLLHNSKLAPKTTVHEEVAQNSALPPIQTPERTSQIIASSDPFPSDHTAPLEHHTNTFANALSAKYKVQDKDITRNTDIDAAWSEFESLTINNKARYGSPQAAESKETSSLVGGSEKKQKGKKLKLVLGGSGGRQA
ncbi:hypothetical protein L204_103493 [Cryptococcus depauperatus]